MFDPALLGDRTFLLGMVAIHFAAAVVFGGMSLTARHRADAFLWLATAGGMAIAAVVCAILWLATFK